MVYFIIQFSNNLDETKKMNCMSREILFTENTDHYAEGSILVSAGRTKILCNASIIDSVPRFLRDKPQSWLTAEYSMLPRATHTRVDRDIQRGKLSPRSSEIQRLIGRCLRASINLKAFVGYTINIDCDVLQADGSTRCHAINGGQVALIRAIQKLQMDNIIKKDPLQFHIAAVSAGFVKQKAEIDLNYAQDHIADVDMNIIMNEHGDLIEIQGTAEQRSFSRSQLNELLDLAWPKIEHTIQQQKNLLATPYPYED